MRHNAGTKNKLINGNQLTSPSYLSEHFASLEIGLLKQVETLCAGKFELNLLNIVEKTVKPRATAAGLSGSINICSPGHPTFRMISQEFHVLFAQVIIRTDLSQFWLTPHRYIIL